MEAILNKTNGKITVNFGINYQYFKAEGKDNFLLVKITALQVTHNKL